MTVAANGRIGVGTTTPSTSLGFGGDVVRSIGVERATTGAGLGLSISPGGAAVGATDTDGGQLSLSSGTATGNGGSSIALKVATSFQGAGTTDRTPTTAMFIDKNLRVGIGVSPTFPSAPLQVTAYGGVTLRLTALASGPGSLVDTRYELTNGSGTKADFASLAAGIQTNTAGAENGFISFSPIRSGTVTEAARLTANGSLGLGTTAPAAGLDIATTGTIASAIIVPRDTTANRPTIAVNGMLRYNNTLNVMEGFINNTWQTLAAQASGGAGFLPLSGGTMTGTLAANNGSVSAPGVSFANDATTGLYSAGAGILNIATSGTTRLSVLANGNVGIGSSTPGVNLDVAGRGAFGQLSGGIGTPLQVQNTHTGQVQDLGVGVDLRIQGISTGMMASAWSANSSTANAYLSFNQPERLCQYRKNAHRRPW